MSEQSVPADGTGLEIAIIGMDGRFPQAPTLEKFWELLRDGVEAISFYSEEELLAAGFSADLLAQPNFVRAASYLEDADLFDATFFDLSPREAEIIDPQQRLLLEYAASALERSGYAGTRRPVGVFAGVSQSSYVLNNLITHPDLVASVGSFSLWIANDRDFVATRLAYKLDLSGPAFTVQTACSTSLVAVHLACQSLLAGECEIALAGSSTVRVPRKGGSLYHPGGITSSDGHCRTFDAKAEGTVGGQGVAVVILKLLSDALADGDHIHAVIKGSAINNDGSLKAGFTAPSRDGQAKVIRAAQLRAAVGPDSIGYVEAHGTATPLGDPIEIAALTLAFRQATQRRGFCAIGSVKTNIGHLDAAAGISGLVKAVLAIEKKAIPPSLHFEKPNPEIDFESSPFYVNTRLAEWPANGSPRRAAVSSFGLGGTNAHVILEEAPAPALSGPSRPWQVVPLSARSPEALERATDELASHLEAHPEQSFADVAYTLQVGRWAFRHRRAVVAADAGEAAAALRSRDSRRVWTLGQELGDRAVAFLLPGVGDQYPGLARGLYEAEPAFRAEIDRCAELLRPHLALDLRDALFGGAESATESRATGLDLRAMLRREAPAWEGPLRDTRIAQPAMFAVGYALARLWMSWGVRPQALLGYSLGEYTAACLAGVLSLEDALTLVARRAQLIAELPAGGMLAVPLPESEIAGRLSPELAVAAVNAPSLCVVSGPAEAVAGLERTLGGEGVACRRLPVGAAFHSPLMETIAGPLESLVRSLRLSSPRLPYLSNVTGTWIRGNEATDPAYWVRHLCRTVRFADGIRELWREPGRILLELGPGQTLGSAAMQLLPAGDPGSRAVFGSLRHELDRQPDPCFLLETLSRLWLAGVEVDWQAFHAGERRRRLPLPTYPFERQRFWIEPRARGPVAAKAADAQSKVQDMANWFHAISWKRAVTPPDATSPEPPGSWLVLLDEQGIGERLVERLASAGREVVTVRAGGGFSRSGERSYTLAPGLNQGWETLLAEVGTPPARIVHLWCLTAGAAEAGDAEEVLERGFYSLLSLAQALAKQASAQPVEIVVAANGVCEVESGDSLHPAKSTLLGPLRVMPLEISRLACRLIDLAGEEVNGEIAGRLLAEIEREGGEPLVACRGGHRWLPTLEPVRLPAGDGRQPLLRDEGVYLVTGGLGGIGLAVARHVASVVRRPKLVLLGRSGLPDRRNWDREETLAGADMSRRIREVRELEASGAEVLVVAADVAERREMRRVLADAKRRFGRIEGVFHAAGIPGAGLIQLKTRDAASQVLAPKVQGTLVLDEVLRDEPPDFMVLFSSVAVITGGIGQVDYCAANTFLDAFARSQRAAGRTAVFAIAWGEWQWDRWTSQLVTDPEILEVLRRHRETYGMTFEEGMEAMRRVMASGLSPLIVSTRPPQALVAAQHSLQQLIGGLDRLAQTRVAADHGRPALATAYVAPRSEVEEKLVLLWQEILGIRQIGVDDNFFQLGGHSLLGLQLLSRIHASFGVELPLRIVFEAPTVASLAAALEDERAAAGSPALPEIGDLLPADAEAMLKNLDQLSEADVDALLTQMLAGEEGIPG